ncbi:MAG: transposase [Patescibacteria group bacterium]
MERKIVLSEGEYYHIYNRGVEKREIFKRKSDYQRFVKLLYLSNSENGYVYRDLKNKSLSEIKRNSQITAVGSYCLMPNHFHLLLKETKPNGISKFMEKLATGYSMYFNKKYNRVGPLFQNRFKAQHVAEDSYLEYLYFYISLNPVKLIQPKWKEEGIKNIDYVEKYLNNYKFSSYLDYIGIDREEMLILDTKVFPEYFEKRDSFKNFADQWLKYSNTKGSNTKGSPM